ncbi:metallophosphoesterase [Methylobacterium organophilum]|uniref:3',5'-cyclic adenosine monophosphate phosphodiesterase CpdA n=1 Tax=Methylobacterium organophilum TaxID=410 RepID=A0ABQ4T4G1_METOR|nr:metallophosphoesterase [Methylobacterium organophilum]GJE26123.1 3',5'-cyclic adenosine monophosphate phosphodiesterase CpdA [Methylobacterium organophilum]
MLLLPSRRQVLGGLSASLLAGGSTACYAFCVEPRFRLVTTAYALTPPGWTPGLHLRIAVIADIHVCEPWMPLARVEEIVAAANALSPDLILLLGDYPASRTVTWRRVPLTDFAKLAAGLRAPLGVHAILGNHDWWDDEAAMRARKGPVESRRLLEAQGIPVMENDAIRLVKDGHAFWLAGLADQEPFLPVGSRRSLADLPGTLAKVSDAAPVILMAHEPDIFLHMPERVALTLAGHTHGGQIRIFGTSPMLIGTPRERYAYGHVVEGRRHLIVSGGLGVSKVAVRFGVPPEIVLVELGTPATV